MTSTPKSGKYVCESDNHNTSPLSGPEPGGHKASFRSTKLAKRARSFKDDVLEKISQMRSPTNQGLKGRPPKRADPSDNSYNKGPIDELNQQFKQLQLALKHFRDVVLKKTLEMLPGNGTIVLDTIWAINLIVQRTIGPSDKTKSIKSATQRMYNSVGKLIKLCDDALIDETCSALDKQNVDEVVNQLEDSVKALIKEVQDKMTAQQPNSGYMSAPRPSHSSLDAPAQRNSLPDIPLTPRDLEKLEDSSCPSRVVRSSHSTESILRDSSPPPKPPLPRGLYSKESGTIMTPPPLPPKKKHIENFTYFNSDSSIFKNSFERMSLISRSLEDSSSILSESAGSLDSMLNNSRDEEEEDEITAIMDPSTDNESILESDLSGMTTNGLWHDDIQNTSSHSSQTNNEDANSFTLHRLSNTDSGFMSVQSHRSSSYSKRSSQQSVVSTQWTSQKTCCVKQEAVVFSSSSSKMASSNNAIVSELNASYGNIDECDDGSNENVPPPIPQKMRRRQPSPYDNVPENNMGGDLLVTCHLHQSHSRSNTSVSMIEDNGKPPPLPLKKRHMFQSVAYSVMAYMEMFGNCSHSGDTEFITERHSMVIQGQRASHPPQLGLPTTQSCSFSHTSSCSRSMHSQTLTIPHTSGEITSPIPSPIRSPNLSISPIPPSGTPPALPPKRSRSSSAKSSPPPTPQGNIQEKAPAKSLPDLLEHTSVIIPKEEVREALVEVKPCDVDLMEAVDITDYLVFKSPEDDGPDIRGGCIDALIIQATKATKNGVFTYQEAFLTTYRTFIAPSNLIAKLLRRFKYFYPQPDKKPEKKKEAFALLIRVVSDLTPLDLDKNVQQMLMDFVQLLISYGEITLAKALRVKHLDKHDCKVLSQRPPVVEITTKTPQASLLDFKSEQIAEQMTFLDAELFVKIEIPEVLIWAEEQNEERSPNLTRFTEHFNKVSYWARTKVLLAEAKDREKYCIKFIKIMKHLRKINNFNSYLALLSALDSAPIRRLEWQKQIQEGLKEYCALIDSSSSFRAYRMALADAQPPCIPYIGLVLQDLTFVHIGNTNLLSNGLINFSKRWQQYHIVENMKRFKKCSYPFKKNEKIIDFFQNFDDHISEDEMWAKSEAIKPRGSKKTQ
ncbi:guanine nucleotide-releasing factor 2 isoform X3 [Onthophagus taurus]|uniref:guanine nucleotide-releasing factor 2 isoform X3 n=1 Tax=Onthophagus taurus TaxID=166361 RepID=UPI0039BE8F79